MEEEKKWGTIEYKEKVLSFVEKDDDQKGRKEKEEEREVSSFYRF